MTRVRYILAATFTLAVVGFAVVAMWPPSPGVTQANFDRIEYGMTLAEVEAIFGRSADFSVELMNIGITHMWTSPSGGRTDVVISKKGVIQKDWPEADETIIRKIRRRLFGPQSTGVQRFTP